MRSWSGFRAKGCCWRSSPRGAENHLNGFLLLIRKEMAITFPHFLGLVAKPFVNDPLIEAERGTIGGEAMPKYMPTANLVPFAVRQKPLQMVICLVLRQPGQLR